MNLKDLEESKPRPGDTVKAGEIVATGKIEDVLDYHETHGWQIVYGSGRWEPDPFRLGYERYVVDVVKVEDND